MIIDLLHNKIVADTISEDFKRSVAEGLVPALEGVYGERMLGIQMYEDYLADGFSLEGVFYYPMTVILEDEQVTHWISWRIDGSFTDSVPYAYKGEELIDFDLDPAVPLEFETAIIGRGKYCEEGLIKINVHSTSPSPTFLAGKYSQSFIDEMARQLTPKIEELMSVSGLSESGLELELVFAPATYMEHHSENVTYRRLLMTDKASAPRDFWVKWTNHRENTPFTVSDSPLGDEIEFEIGEGVPQKLREKEYRYLIRTNNDKYQKAMGKRNITEWRDLIKRALKRGRLTKVAVEIPLDEETILVNEKLAGALGLSSADVVSSAVETEAEDRNRDIARELAKAAGLELEDEVSFDEESDEAAVELGEDEALVIGDEADEVPFDEEPMADKDEDDLLLTISLARETVANRMAEKDDEDEVEFDLDGTVDFDELPVAEDEELEDELDTEDEIDIDEDLDEELDAEEEIEDESETEPYEEEDEFEEILDEESFEDDAEDEPEEPAVVEKIVRINEGPSADEIEAKIREGLEAKIRLEYEQKARESAEAEMLKLRREQEQLLIENRRLEAQAKKELEERKRISEQRKLEEARLRAQIETQVRAEAKERERLAEAARLAVEEQRKMETERLLAERQKIEEERRAAEERARAEAEARLQAERQLEAERIRQASKPTEVEEPKHDGYTYIAKTVKLLFRYSVDPNITGRIHEIIKATLEYYEKDKLHIRVRASVPDQSSVVLEFIEFPKEELELLQNIIKVLGNSGIGIAKAILEDPKK